MTSYSAPAPGELETLRGFVNTVDLETGADDIAGPAGLADHLSLPVADVTAADVARATELREAFRDALGANHDRTPMPPAAVAVFNAVAGRAGLAFTLDPAGRWTARSDAGGVAGALGRLLLLMTDAVADGTWSRLKVCVNDGCRWAFYDGSRARTGRWCSMRLCGNRAKQQAWRARSELRE